MITQNNHLNVTPTDQTEIHKPTNTNSTSNQTTVTRIIEPKVTTNKHQTNVKQHHQNKHESKNNTTKASNHYSSIAQIKQTKSKHVVKHKDNKRHTNNTAI